MAKYLRKQNRFNFLGLNLTRAIDNLPEGKYPIAKNIRSYQQGIIQSRPGETAFNSTASGNNLVHSIKRLNDDIPTASQTYAIFAGVGTSIYSDTSSHNSLTSRASGFSGLPISLVPFRPSNSPEPYLYVMDSFKAGKFKVDGSFSNLGISAPTSAPTVVLGTVPFNVFASLSTGVANGWAVGGTTGVAVVNQSRTNTTITRILFDSGTTGWCSIQPASFQEINVGSRLSYNGALQALVEFVFKPAHTTSILAIAYDSGTTGLCSIVLTATSKEGLIKDACLVLNAGTGNEEMVRIIDVIEGLNNSLSIRTSTSVNHIATETVTGISTYRSFLTINQIAGTVLTETVHRLPIATGIGTYSVTVNIDASTIANRPVTPKDYVHIGIKMNLPQNLVEGKLMFDCDETTNDFTKNFFYFAFNSNDFTPAVNDIITTLTARQKKLQNNLIDAQSRGKQNAIDRINRKLAGTEERLKQLQASATTPPLGVTGTSAARFETVAGASQWTEFFIHLGEDHLTRVGGDTSRGLANIKAVRLQFNVSAATNIDVADFYFAGTYGLEVSPIDTPYIYCYRYRSSTTGAISSWSPIMRTGIIPRRQLATILPTVSGDSQVDKIDIARFGGTLNTWIIIGTQSNSGSFGDELPDNLITGLLEANLTEGYQPFPILTLPTSSTVNVVGITVTRTAGDNFNVDWIPGIDIIINGQLYTLYQVISSTVLQLKENAGSQTSVNCVLPAPEKAASLLPFMFGPFNHEGELGSVMFACGDSFNAGTLYWTNPDNPDLSSDKNYIEVCSPSEPLMNGFVHDSRAWLFSTEDLYQIYPTRTSDNRLSFNASKAGIGLGLAGRYFFCLSEGKIVFGTRDGIYITEGSSPISITDDDLYPLFPHDGQIGQTINGFIPPDFNSPNTLRLSAGDSEIYFDYLGTDSNYHTLMYNELTKAWVADDYARQINMRYFEEGKNTHRWLLGGINGKIFINSGLSDDSVAISCEVRTLSEDGGDFRTKKKMGDFLVDHDSQGATLVAQLGFDNYSVLPTPTNLVVTTGRRQDTIDINSGLWTYAKNVALDISWSSSTGIPQLYGYEFDAIQTEEDTLKRSTDADNAGIESAKFWQGFRIRSNTYNLAKTFKVQADNGINGIWTDIESFSITSNGESVQPFSFTIPYIAHLSRIVGLDNNPWSLIDVEWVVEPEPELVENWITQQTTHNFSNYQHIGFFQITLMSTDQVNLVVNIDGVNLSPIAIQSTAGLRLKRYVRIPAAKGKTFQYKLTTNTLGTGFRVYIKDLEVAIKPWSSNEAYQIVQPFGDLSRESGARI